MWKSGCCLLIAIVLAVIGLIWDILLEQKGKGDLYGLIHVEVSYGFKKLEYTIEADHVDNITRSVEYSTAYNTYCTNSTHHEFVSSSSIPDFCHDLFKLENAGLYYMGSNVAGTFLMLISCFFAIIITLSRWFDCECDSSNECLCCSSCGSHTDKNGCDGCRRGLRWFMTGLCLLGIGCYAFAFGIFLIDYNDDLNDLLNILLKEKINWDEAKIGSSIACLFGAASAGVIAFGVIVYVDRDYSSSSISSKRNNSRNSRSIHDSSRYRSSNSSGNTRRVNNNNSYNNNNREKQNTHDNYYYYHHQNYEQQQEQQRQQRQQQQREEIRYYRRNGEEYEQV